MTDQDSERAAKVAMTLLRHLHAWGPVHEPPPDSTDTGRRLQLPDPFSTTQAVLAVLSSLTKRHSIALKVNLNSCSKLAHGDMFAFGQMEALYAMHIAKLQNDSHDLWQSAACLMSKCCILLHSNFAEKHRMHRVISL